MEAFPMSMSYKAVIVYKNSKFRVFSFFPILDFFYGEKRPKKYNQYSCTHAHTQCLMYQLIQSIQIGFLER